MKIEESGTSWGDVFPLLNVTFVLGSSDLLPWMYENI